MDENLLDTAVLEPKSRSNIPNFENKILLLTYSALTSSNGIRLEQLLKILGNNFDGVVRNVKLSLRKYFVLNEMYFKVILDECHRAKGCLKTKTGILVQVMQERLPNARFVYVSATAATTPDELAYMERLGLWGPGTVFRDANEFTLKLEERYIFI